jgi:beta-xylosidase
MYPFGHGLSYTTFGYSDLSVCPVGAEPGNGAGPGLAGAAAGPGSGGGSGGGVRARIGTDGAAEIACTVRNTGAVAGAEVVQLYLHDPVAQVTRPVRALAGFARVTLPPGGACRVAFRLHADRTAFHGLAGTRIVEPGLIELAIGSSAGDLRLHGELELAGPERQAGAGRVLTTPVSVTALVDE